MSGNNRNEAFRAPNKPRGFKAGEARLCCDRAKQCTICREYLQQGANQAHVGADTSGVSLPVLFPSVAFSESGVHRFSPDFSLASSMQKSFSALLHYPVKHTQTQRAEPHHLGVRRKQSGNFALRIMTRRQGDVLYKPPASNYTMWHWRYAAPYRNVLHCLLILKWSIHRHAAQMSFEKMAERLVIVFGILVNILPEKKKQDNDEATNEANQRNKQYRCHTDRTAHSMITMEPWKGLIQLLRCCVPTY